ncbi:DEAD/DEAH box helicase [Actinomadura chokoriensis]|uniref:DEAD/DEAH box helicase n=2 Tax=Actinomadura chokoriensis TaxID=454156 RepID=A0ABV4R938_9ACTN
MMLWEAQAPAVADETISVPVSELVPRAWHMYLPFPTLNPAQAEAVERILDSDDHLVVVAPTGAGKTVIGMVSALNTIFEQGRKAVWLVPQRSLTAELDQELEGWRKRGLRVERLSGEFSVDVERTRNSDLWVATTEKFEAMCRTVSLREALAEVNCLIVDEIHLLGDPTRGGILEALLARLKSENPKVRIIGLSATVSNADQVAQWLGARLIKVSWRPSKLTWQLPVVAANKEFSQVDAARTRLATSLTRMITADGGSVVVFCGSKRGVRRMALIIAGDRGVNIRDVHPDDLDRLHEACEAAGIGLHYKGWDHKLEAERRFRARKLQILVATSTVAAGVNLPARAVVVRDTEIGFNKLDVATVQQMFGRAGRVGAGETQGWAFLIVDEAEHASWQRRLVAGNTVHSQIGGSLADHVLGEAVQQRISTVREAERWWVETFAYQQGSESQQPLREAISALVDGGFATETHGTLQPTDLGGLTARMMVPAAEGSSMRLALSRLALPEGPEEAEFALISALCQHVPKFTQASVPEDIKIAVTRLLAARGDLSRATLRPAELPAYLPGDVARVALLVVANNSMAFQSGIRHIGGVPYANLHPILEEAPRYLHWISAQGPLGTVPPWSAIVAADLGRRVRWRRCKSGRGAGRLLWMCEQMSTPAYAESTVASLWDAATSRGIVSPDWLSTTPPKHCRLVGDDYMALLRDRATSVTVNLESDRVTAVGPAGSVLAVWTDKIHEVVRMRGTSEISVPMPGVSGAAVFTRRGDYHGIGWLAKYSRMHAVNEG